MDMIVIVRKPGPFAPERSWFVIEYPSHTQLLGPATKKDCEKYYREHYGYNNRLRDKKPA